MFIYIYKLYFNFLPSLQFNYSLILVKSSLRIAFSFSDFCALCATLVNSSHRRPYFTASALCATSLTSAHVHNACTLCRLLYAQPWIEGCCMLNAECWMLTDQMIHLLRAPALPQCSLCVIGSGMLAKRQLASIGVFITWTTVAWAPAASEPNKTCYNAHTRTRTHTYTCQLPTVSYSGQLVESWAFKF